MCNGCGEVPRIIKFRSAAGFYHASWEILRRCVYPSTEIAKFVHKDNFFLKFIYSEKATKFCKISTLLLSYVVPVKSKVEISQNFVAFSEYMNFNQKRTSWSFRNSTLYCFWKRRTCTIKMNSSIPVWVRHAPNRLRYRRIHGIESRLKREPGGRHGRGRRGWGRNRGHSWRCRPRRSWWPKRGQFRSIMSSWIGLYWTIAAVSAVIGSPRWLGRGCLTAADGRQTAVCSAGPIAATDGRSCSATCAAADATPAAAGRRCAGTAAIAFLVAKFFLTSPFGSPIWKPDLKS